MNVSSGPYSNLGREGLFKPPSPPPAFRKALEPPTASTDPAAALEPALESELNDPVEARVEPSILLPELDADEAVSRPALISAEDSFDEK